MANAGNVSSLSGRRSSFLQWADLAVLGVAFVWGASYPVAKQALLFAPVLVLIFYRFTITAIIMSILARRDLIGLPKGDYIRGLFLGAILFGIFLAETFGVVYTSATNAALIISLCVVFTPFLDYGLARQAPPRGIVLAAVVSCIGVAVLTGGMTAFSFGDLLILCAAVLRAIMVVTTKRLMRDRSVSSTALTALQGLAVASMTLALLLAQGNAKTLVLAGNGSFWAAVMFLSLLCTIAAFYIQNAAVRRSTPTRVSFLMGTEPLFGFLLAHILLAEAMTPASLLGAGLIVAGTFAGIASENRR